MIYPGEKLRTAIKTHAPLQVVGVIHAYAARMAERVGHQAIYLSGAGIANARYALPDLGMTALPDVLAEVSAITAACKLPLIVDIDTGWGSPLNVRRSIQLISGSGAAAVHIEDQTEAKRCGHRNGQHLISTEEMVMRLKAAKEGKNHPSFMVIARTDALHTEGMTAALKRAQAYEAAGADGIFLEAATELSHYELFAQHLKIPLLANITEFGKTPLFTRQALAKVGVSVILYPLSAFRAMNLAALKVYKTILKQGTQQSELPNMQTREELYHYLDYQQYEEEVENYFKLMERENGSI